MIRLFTDDDRERIQEAVAAAEGYTSGEIVPYVVEDADEYPVATWRGVAYGVLLGLVPPALVFAFYTGWGLAWMHTGLGVALMAVLGGVLGGLLATFVRPLKRLLIGSDRLTRAVHRRAMQAFVEEEVFKTRDRTGILLFVSLFEHRIEVVGDEGINAKVEADDWVEVVARVRRGIVEKKPGEGLVEAIALCGDLLRRRGVEIRDDDTDELPNRLRLGD